MLCGLEGTSAASLHEGLALLCYLTEEDVIDWRFQTRIIGESSIIGAECSSREAVADGLVFFSYVTRAWQYIRL